MLSISLIRLPNGALALDPERLLAHRISFAPVFRVPVAPVQN